MWPRTRTVGLGGGTRWKEGGSALVASYPLEVWPTAKAPNYHHGVITEDYL
jgi:hypothetical protein